ncbi:MAG TPA: YihY/virulence factor BrkB family protein [Thermoanaerobaculia bacterium]|jgi:membrane protein
MHRPQRLWKDVQETLANWSRHNATTHGAALAYLSMFSLAPLLILVIAVSGWAFGASAARGEIQRELSRFIGANAAAAVQTLVAASARPHTGRLAAIIGSVTILASATAVLMQLQDTLNTVWEVSPKPGFFLRAFFKKRLLCLLLILGAGALVLLSLAASAGLAALRHVLAARLEVGLAKLLGGVDVVLSWLLMALLLAMIYRLLPDVEIGWRDVAWGSAVTAVLFTLGKYAIGFYLARAGVTSTYGAAGSLVLVLVWVYFSSLIFLLGAEFTRVHSRRYREGRAPASPGAVRVATVQVPLEPTPAATKGP